MSRYYRKGYRTAKRYVRLSSPTHEVFNNVKPFLEAVYKEAVSGMSVPLEESVALTRTTISELEQKIENFRKEEDGLRTKMANPNLFDNDDAIQKKSTQLALEIEVLNKRIEDMKLELATVQKEHIQESASEKAIKINLGTERIFHTLHQKIGLLIKEIAPMLGILFLVLVDYVIAVTFFSAWAEGRGGVSEIVFGWFIPLAITLMCMVVLHIGIDFLRKSRKPDASFMSVVFSVTAFMFVVLLIASILAARIDTEGVAILPILIWLLFVGLVFTAAYKLDRDNKEALSLLTTPLLLLGNTFALIFMGVLWPFEKIYTLMTNMGGTNRSKELKKGIIFLRDKISQCKAEKEQKEKQMIDIPKNKAKHKLQQIALKKQENAVLLEPDMRKIKSLINHSQSMLLKHKGAEKNLIQYLVDIRQGSNDGAMDQLYKKIKKDRRTIGK